MTEFKTRSYPKTQVFKCYYISSRGEILPSALVNLSAQSVYFPWSPNLRTTLNYPLWRSMVSLLYGVLPGPLLCGLIVSALQLNTCKFSEFSKELEQDYIYIRSNWYAASTIT